MTQTTGVEWLWRDRLAPLLDHPGEWTVVHQVLTYNGAPQAAYLLRRGTLRVPPGKWEFRSAGVEVLARYNGPD